MTTQLNRRTFLGTSLAVTAASAALTCPPTLFHLLQAPDAPAQVLAVLQEHLGLEAAQAPFVTAFTASLKDGLHHHQSGAAFTAQLQAGGSSDEVALYILQEFVTTTNYLSFHTGVDPVLTMLPAAPQRGWMAHAEV